MESSIDNFVEQGKQMAGQQKPDPTAATNQTALQIETIKQTRQKQKDDADTQLKAAELKMRDDHERAKIASQERMKLAELTAKQGDAEQKAQLANQKAMHDREGHEMSMMSEQAKMAADARKMEMAEQAAIARQGDMAARTAERQAAAAMKPPPQGGFPGG